jgi:PAS domain S-box-containing protein
MNSGNSPPAALRASLGGLALHIAVLYACVAWAWIALSDRVLGRLVADPEALVWWGMVKGLLFVAATAGLLYAVLRRSVRNAERALASAEHEEQQRRRAEAIVASTDDAILSKTLDGVITSWNPAARSMFGYTAEEAVGNPIDRLLPAELLAQEQAISSRIGSGERVEQLESVRVRKDGRYIPVAITFSPITRSRDPSQIIGISEIVRDITARREAEAAAERERRFARNLIEAMPGIFYLYDKDGHFLRWNQNFERVSGYSGDEIARMHPTDFFGPADQANVRACMDRVFETGESSVEAAFLLKDGSTCSYSFTGKRILFDGLVCLVGVGVDISERKQAEEGLEVKIAERTRDLEAARVRAEEADRIKSAFLATMSHELRTPLNSIIGFTGIVLQGLAGPLTPEQTRQLSMVQGSARHLLALINDVLDISKIEARQLEIRPITFDLRASIERVASLVSPLAEKKGLALRIHTETSLGQIWNDQRRFEQILLNLLNNAIKFTERGEVALTAELEGEQVYIRVADTGIGMKEQDLAQLFQPFRQIDSGLQRQHEGTGLGLAICRKLAGLLGGSIRAESTWGRGSVFAVTLPVRWSPS